MGAEKWISKGKLRSCSGVNGNREINELCNDHGITQGMYYKWGALHAR